MHNGSLKICLLNFAISTKGAEKGVNHLGIQYNSDEDLIDAQKYFESKDINGVVDNNTTCCYKASNKYWLKDPTNIVWEHYHSSEDIEVFGNPDASTDSACCTPTLNWQAVQPKEDASECCSTSDSSDTCCS